MTPFALDTDTLSLFRRNHPQVVQRIAGAVPGDVGITVITVEEQLSGWYALLRQAKMPAEIARTYDRLAQTVTVLAGFPILSFTENAVNRFQQLQALKLNVGSMDLRIAAIALEEGAVVVTRNTRDFARVPNLTIEDWTQ